MVRERKRERERATERERERERERGRRRWWWEGASRPGGSPLAGPHPSDLNARPGTRAGRYVTRAGRSESGVGTAGRTGGRDLARRPTACGAGCLFGAKRRRSTGSQWLIREDSLSSYWVSWISFWVLAASDSEEHWQPVTR